MVRRLIEQKNVRPLQQQLAQRDAAFSRPESGRMTASGGGQRRASIACFELLVRSHALAASSFSWMFPALESFSIASGERSASASFSFTSSNC
jgi:hypothetical protein